MNRRTMNGGAKPTNSDEDEPGTPDFDPVSDILLCTADLSDRDALRTGRRFSCPTISGSDCSLPEEKTTLFL